MEEKLIAWFYGLPVSQCGKATIRSHYKAFSRIMPCYKLSRGNMPHSALWLSLLRYSAEKSGGNDMIRKITLSTLLLCSSGLVMAEDVVTPQVEATDAATQMESMQIRAKAVDKPAVPANVPTKALAN